MRTSRGRNGDNLRVLSTRYLVLSTVLLLSGASASGDDSAATFLGRTSEQWQFRIRSDHPQVRAEAAWAIAQYVERDLQRNESLPLLMLNNLDFHHTDATVRFWMIQGLQRLAVAKGARKEARETLRVSLQKSLEDKSPAPRLAAAETLGLLGDTEAALPVLVEAMNDPQDAVRIQAVASLEKLGEAARPAEATLRAAACDSSEYVKRISARALQKLEASK
jgi:HEAT repeat protein